MAVRLAELAALVSGNIVGDAALEITGAATLECAKPGEITLVDKADKIVRLARSQAVAVLVPLGVEAPTMSTIQVAEVHGAFAKIVQHFRPQPAASPAGIHASAIVEASAKLASDVTIHAMAFIDHDVEIGSQCVIHSGARILRGSKVGPGCTIFANAVLYEGTIIGPRCIVHAGASLGAYGFGYKIQEGRHILSAQLGYVELHADVEVGANTTIDRGTYGPTIIGEGTKIDNLVMIAHNCRLGKHNLICSQVGIAGSTTTGDYVVMAGQVGVRDHVHIGNGAVLGAMSGVANDVPDKAHMLGAPAIPERDQKLQFATLAKLPEMRKMLKDHEKKLNLLLGEETKPETRAA
jgi:UDP-3-O-[3-hydroxymyristoyl] glucosamine N-acyltransferase